MNVFTFNNGQKIECVNQYNYLGIMFTSRLRWSSAENTMAIQADKSVFMLKRTIQKLGDVPLKLCLDLFAKIVSPILLYGAEIWGTQKRETIELVHRKYCKYILNVSYST